MLNDFEQAMRLYRRYAKARKVEHRRWRRIIAARVDCIWVDTRWGEYLNEHPLVFAWASAKALADRLYRELLGGRGNDE